MKFTRKQKSEIIADIIFFIIPVIISLIAVFVFDIHWSFYEKPYYPFQYVFKTIEPYVYGPLLGGIIGFLLLKLASIGFIEEGKVLKK